jgi:multidrug transporter EmrE-like cation transporter
MPMRRTLVLVFASVAASVTANLLLKETMIRLPASTTGALVSAALRAPGLWVGVALWGIGFLLWLRVLATEEISRVFPIVVGAAFVATLVVSTVFLDEEGSTTSWAGLALVSIGIAICGGA